MRLLHVVQPMPPASAWWSARGRPCSGAGALACVRWLIEAAGSGSGRESRGTIDEHMVCVMGGRDALQLSRDAGLEGVASLGAPLGSARLAGAEFRALVSSLAMRPDGFVAWGEHLSELREALAPRDRGLPWVEVIGSSATARLADGGAAIEFEPSVPSERGLPAEHATAQDDATARSSPSVPARVAMLAAPLVGASARTTLNACEILTVAGLPAIAQLDRSAHDAEACVSVAARSYTPGVLWTRRHPLRAVRGADLAILAPPNGAREGVPRDADDGRGASHALEVRSLLACAAMAGVPLAMSPSAARASGIDGATLSRLGCVASASGPAEIAKIALPMLEDRERASACVHALRERFVTPHSGMLTALRDLIGRGASERRAAQTGPPRAGATLAP
jgi:hypothetical protein